MLFSAVVFSLNLVFLFEYFRSTLEMISEETLFSGAFFFFFFFGASQCQSYLLELLRKKDIFYIFFILLFLINIINVNSGFSV